MSGGDSVLSPVTPDNFENFIGLQTARGVLCASNASVKQDLMGKAVGPPIIFKCNRLNLLYSTCVSLIASDVNIACAKTDFLLCSTFEILSYQNVNVITFRIPS